VVGTEGIRLWWFSDGVRVQERDDGAYVTQAPDELIRFVALLETGSQWVRDAQAVIRKHTTWIGYGVILCLLLFSFPFGAYGYFEWQDSNCLC